MAGVNGLSGALKISATQLLNLQNMTWDQTMETVDNSACGATDRTHTTLLKGATISADAIRDGTTDQFDTEIIAGIAGTILFHPLGTGSSLPQKSATATVTGVSESVPMGDNIINSITLLVNGEQDFTAQAA